MSSHDLEAHDRLELSVVIPAYNEEHRLPSTLLSILEYLDGRSVKYEVIVVDDGSRDATARLVRQFARLSPQVKLLMCPRNRGKGFAVRLGMMNALGDLVLYDDADGASPIEELARLEEAIQGGADIAIGSRAIFAKDTAVKTILIRKMMGRIFNTLVNVVLLPKIADTQCGFKLFKRAAARQLFALQRADGFSFDVEVLFLARRAGFAVAEIPINWTNIPGSKVSLVRDSFLMFVDVVRFRLTDLFGGYKK